MKTAEQQQSYAEIGKQDMSYAKISKQDLYNAKISEQYLRSAKIGKQDISYLVYTEDNGLTKLIEQKSSPEKTLSLSDLIRWVASNHNEAKEILERS